MMLESCPQCSAVLRPPLSSGRQVCMKCGWSSHPRSSHTHNTAAIADDASSSTMLSALCHGSYLLTPVIAIPVIIPIVLLVGCNSSSVKANAKEAINFYIYSFIVGILVGTALFVGLLLPFLLLIVLPIVVVYVIASFVLPIWAIVQVCQNPQQPVTYPLIQRLIS